MRKRKILLVFYSIVLLLPSVLAFYPLDVAQAVPNEETRSPTSNSGQWIDGANAYASDDAYAWAFQIFDPVHTYSDYGFSLDGVDIEEVLIGVEYYLSASPYHIHIQVYDGTSWSAWSDPFSHWEEEVMLWLDYTTVFDWTPEKVNAIQTRIMYSLGEGGACYPNNMYFVVIENSSLLGRDLLNITDWQFYNPKQIQESLEQNRTLYVLSWNEIEGWFVNENSRVVQVDEHDEGNYTLYDMYSGELDINYTDEDGKEKKLKWESHIELTSNHKIPYFDGSEWILDTSESLFNHWDNGETVYVNHLWWNYSLKPFPVTDVKVTKKFTRKVYNVWTQGDMESTNETLIQYKKGKTLSEQEYDMLMHLKKCGVPIGEFPPFLAVTTKIPYTAYLNWIPVRITHSEAEEEEIWDCSYIGLNSTCAGSVAELSADWTDLKASKDLDMFLFSWNNSGTIENSTWMSSWDANWTRVTRTLNATIGLPISFRFIVNDSVGIEYPSSICFFTTEAPSRFNWFPVVLILGVVLFLAVVFALTKT